MPTLACRLQLQPSSFDNRGRARDGTDGRVDGSCLAGYILQQHPISGMPNPAISLSSFPGTCTPDILQRPVPCGLADWSISPWFIGGIPRGNNYTSCWSTTGQSARPSDSNFNPLAVTRRPGTNLRHRRPGKPLQASSTLPQMTRPFRTR
jgi:hypothetical protein